MKYLIRISQNLSGGFSWAVFDEKRESVGYGVARNDMQARELAERCARGERVGALVMSYHYDPEVKT